MPGTNSADWQADTISKLLVLWGEGHSTAEIGRRMGISKNAVVGKAHRLDLPPRPSPIRRGTLSPQTRPPGPICPPLAQLVPLAPALSPVPARTFPKPAGRPIVVPRGNMPCCWPIGEPSSPSFHFCGADNALDKPYCPEHCTLAYRKRRRSAEGDVLASTERAAVQSAQGGMG